MKRIFAMVFSVILVLSVSSFSFAGQSIGNTGVSYVQLNYEVPASYTVTIPDSIVTMTSDSIVLPLYLSGNIPSVAIKVASNNNLLLRNTSDTQSTIAYSIKNSDGSTLSTETPITLFNDTDTKIIIALYENDCQYATAGTYTDTLTFTIQAN